VYDEHLTHSHHGDSHDDDEEDMSQQILESILHRPVKSGELVPNLAKRRRLHITIINLAV
jgi:hypothetical protein